MARKPNMWSASAAVGDSELRGIPEGWAPERDGTVELPRSAASPSPSVYSVGKLGGAHRRSERSSGGQTSGRGSTSGRSSSGRGQSIIGRAGAAWTSVQPSGEQSSAGPDQTSGEWTSTGSPYLSPPQSGSPYIDPPHAGPPYIDPPFPGAGNPGYPPGAYPTSSHPVSSHQTGSYPTSSHQTGSYPISGHQTGSYPTSGHRTGSYPTSSSHQTGSYPTSSSQTGSYPTSSQPSASRDGRRGGSHAGKRPSSGRRPVRYTGSRRRFSGWAPLAGGALMLALVLGATTMAESGRYSDDTGTASGGSTPANSTAASAAPTKAVDSGPAQAVATALNKELDTLGCGRVQVDQSLVTAAQKQVDDMVSSNGSGTLDTKGTLARAKTAGYTGTQVAEAMVTGAGSPAQAAELAFPEPGTSTTAPAAVQVVNAQPLSCGWTALGAQAQLSGGQVTYWSIVLGR